MANGKRASSSMPTEAENLKEPQVLNPTVRSYSLNEYEQKRPDYINPDHNAGKSWAQLGRSLDDFYSAFMKYSDNELQRTMERDVARGAVLAGDLVEAEGAKANRRNWKQLTEEHPELAGYNPWVQQGYNRSRLRNLGREMQDDLQRAMTDSNIYNEEDTEKAKTFINEFCAKWRKDAGIEDEQDAVLLMKSFSPIEAEARQSAMTAYEGHRFQNQQYKLKEACSDEISKILSNPNMSLEQKNAAIKFAVEDANSHGLLVTNSEQVVPEAIKAAYAVTHDEGLLKQCSSISINGRKLIEYKGVPEWISAEEARIAQRQAAEAQKAYVAHQRWVNQMSARGALEIADGVLNGKYSAQEGVQAYIKEHGLSPDAAYELSLKADQKIGVIMRARQNEADVPANAVARDNHIHEIVTGSQDYQSAYDKLTEEYLKTGDKKYYNAAKAVYTQGQKSGMTAEIASNKIRTNVFKELDKDCKAIANDAIKALQVSGDSSGIKSEAHSRYATGELRLRVQDDLDSRVQKKIAIAQEENQGKPIGVVQREQIYNEALQEVRDTLRNDPEYYKISSLMTKENLMQDITNPEAERRDPENMATWDSQINAIIGNKDKTPEEKSAELQDMFRKTGYKRFENAYNSLASQGRTEAKAQEKADIKAAEKSREQAEKDAKADSKAIQKSYDNGSKEIDKELKARVDSAIAQYKSDSMGDDKEDPAKRKTLTDTVKQTLEEDYKNIIATEQAKVEEGNGGVPATKEQMAEIHKNAVEQIKEKMRSPEDPYGLGKKLSRPSLILGADGKAERQATLIKEAVGKMKSSKVELSKDEWDDILREAKIGWLKRSMSFPSDGATTSDLFEYLKKTGMSDVQIITAYNTVKNKRSGR